MFQWMVLCFQRARLSIHYVGLLLNCILPLSKDGKYSVMDWRCFVAAFFFLPMNLFFKCGWISITENKFQLWKLEVCYFCRREKGFNIYVCFKDICVCARAQIHKKSKTFLFLGNIMYLTFFGVLNTNSCTRTQPLYEVEGKKLHILLFLLFTCFLCHSSF